jgi:hypothetical protein
MNKRTHILLFATTLLFYVEGLEAQAPGSAFSLYGGAAITAGNFAKEGGTTFPAWIDNILNSAPSQSPGFPGSGCARTGFTAGVQFTTGGGIGWIINAGYAQNNVSHNPPWRFPSSSSSPGGTVTLETDNWKSASILTGVKIGTAYSQGPNAFIAPLIGVVFVNSPNITATIAEPGTTVTVRLRSASGIALAYGAAAEFTLWKRFVLGSRYIYGTPRFDVPYTFAYGAASQDGTIPHEQSTSIVLFYIGYSF